jgi:hypothetical protein
MLIKATRVSSSDDGTESASLAQRRRLRANVWIIVTITAVAVALGVAIFALTVAGAQ